MKNRGVVFVKPGTVEIREIPFPMLQQKNHTYEHAVIIKVVVTGICGSDLHMYRGRVTVPFGTVFGHEITGEVIECGRDVECIQLGDLVSVPFNVACGRCSNCKAQYTNICLMVNNERPGGAYGYAHMGNWPGGQSDYIAVPFADFNLLKLPSKEISMPKIKDLSLITDVFPTGYHAAYNAQVGIGSHVYIAGAGPVGLACALSCKLLGAATIIVGDVNSERLELVKKNGYIPIDVSKIETLGNRLKQLLGKSEVDIFIDCVGFEAVGYGKNNESQPSILINSAMEVVRAGGTISFPGVYVEDDTKGRNGQEKKGIYELLFGKCWSKGLTLVMGQTPVERYNEKLRDAILTNKCSIAQELNVTIISLDEAPEAYKTFNAGAPVKYIIDPHGMTQGY